MNVSVCFKDGPTQYFTHSVIDVILVFEEKTYDLQVRVCCVQSCKNDSVLCEYLI